jgi:hypothetical protein
METTPTTRRPSARLVRRLIAAVVAVVAVGAASLPLWAGSASAAGHNIGVKYVDFRDGATACFDGQALPCVTGAGRGMSNTIYVSQTEVDGELRYTDVAGTAQDPSEVWLAATLGAECRGSFKMHSVRIAEDHSNYEGRQFPEEVSSWDEDLEARDIAAGAKTMSQRYVPISIPIDQLLDDDAVDLDTDQLLEQGEARVQDAVAGGIDPEVARRTSFEQTFEVPAHAEVECRRKSLFGIFDEREMHESATLPLRIVWLGLGAEAGEEWSGDWRDAQLPAPDPVPAPPASSQAVDVPLTSDTWVTQAHLSVLPDPADECRLHLSGTLVANGETEVSYRFVDHLGQHSDTYQAQIDQTSTTFVDHHVDLEPVVVDGGEFDPGLVAPHEQSIGGLTANPTDRVQGYYRLEVLSPNPLLSVVADYNVEPCIVEAPALPEAAPTSPTPTPTPNPTPLPTPVDGLAGVTTTTTPPNPTPPTPARPGGFLTR